MAILDMTIIWRLIWILLYNFNIRKTIRMNAAYEKNEINTIIK